MVTRPKKESLLFLFQTGYGLITLPITLFSFTTTTYYLLIENIPFLKSIFPEYWIFLVTVIVIGSPVTVFVGFVFAKSILYKASTKYNPYIHLLYPNSIPLYRAVADLCKMNHLQGDAEAIEILIKLTEEEDFTG